MGEKVEKNRFRVEKRTGIVAIYDTKHPDYHDANGCHADFPFVVAHWSGYAAKGDDGCVRWNLCDWQIEKARKLCAMLNGEV
jgi:hypothetical protein